VKEARHCDRLPQLRSIHPRSAPRSGGRRANRTIDLVAMRYHARMSSSAATRQCLCTWLALLAMWLVVLMPDVSQIVASLHEREPIAELCSGGTTSDHAISHPLGSIAQCGYCDLLHVHTPLPGVASPAPVAQMGATPAAAAPSRNLIVRFEGWRPDHPRAPPLST
jgi:hypothetical protein